MVSLHSMTVAWVPVLCSKLGDQAPRSGLTWSAGLLEPGDEVVASKDEEVGGLSLAPSLTALFLCLAVWGWGMEAPLLQSHEASDLEASCGARARRGWGWLQDQLFHPHLSAGSPEGNIPCHPIYHASRGPCEPVRGAEAKGHWCCSGCWEVEYLPPHRSLQAPPSVDSVVQWLALEFWSQGLNPCFTAPESDLRDLC